MQDNDNGFGLTSHDSIAFVEFLASIAHPLNLTLGLKNAGRIVSAVLPVVDFSVNEQCVQYNECAAFRQFIDTGKPVFHIEYPDKAGSSDGSVGATLVDRLCGNNGEEDTSGFSTVLKRKNLDGWVEYCSSTVATTPLNGTVTPQGFV